MPGGEISTSDIVHDAFRQGKCVFVPYTYKLEPPPPNGPQSVMDMVSLHSLDDYKALKPDAWGIPTPSKASIFDRRKCLSSPNSDLKGRTRDSEKREDLDMIIMPGMAFDRGLARLGHGKGFYDFFLQRYQMRVTESENSKKMPFLGKINTSHSFICTDNLTNASLVGLALQEQILEDGEIIPTNASDWRLDALIIGDDLLVRR